MKNNIIINIIANHESYLPFMNDELKNTFIDAKKKALKKRIYEAEIRLKECKKLLSDLK